MTTALADVRPVDAVVLVPGFLGFDRVGGFYYFSERISATLRARLEVDAGRSVPVFPCCTLPIGSFETRQAFLVEQLTRLCDRFPSLRRLHLVGHSAGGVDVQLITCDRPVSGEWSGAAQRVRDKIRSVVAIAAPQRGTALAKAAATRLLADLSLANLRGIGSLARLFMDLVRLVPRQYNVFGKGLLGARSQLPEIARFLRQMFCHRDLLVDLLPERMAELRARVRPDPRAKLTSFVTVATLSAEVSVPPDPFFRQLYELTAQHAQGGDGVSAALSRLQGHGVPVIGGDASTLADATVASSDGVVTSALQLLDPDDPAELAAVVVADHADVIGHYDRAPGPFDDRPPQEGMFHSGSGFDDDRFFQLYGRVGDAIARSMTPA